MDLSFDIVNSEGDQIMVALSYYDPVNVNAVSTDPMALTLSFYDVTLVRKSGTGYVGYKMLFAVSDVLAKFMDENDNAVLCFYCDAHTDVRRSHDHLLPQEYRSQLFSRMFEMYIKSHRFYDLVNHRVMIEDPEDNGNRQFAHFICRKKHEGVVVEMGRTLMEK